jgi:hypothetical protein
MVEVEAARVLGIGGLAEQVYAIGYGTRRHYTGKTQPGQPLSMAMQFSSSTPIW